MKSAKKHRDTLILTGMGLLAIPTLVFGLSGTELDIDYWGSFGSNSVSTTSWMSVAVGLGNVLSSDTSMAVGTGLETLDDNSLIVGRYNSDATDALFIVGKGSYGDPSNAFEIYDDGSICIPEQQGDIDMGVFGN